MSTRPARLSASHGPGCRVAPRCSPRPAPSRSTAGAADEFWGRTGEQPSVDVNMLTAGEPRTVIPSVARAQLSMRLAPGQSAATMSAELERLLREALPDGAELSVDFDLADPAVFDANDPALQIAAGAFERACGTPPAFVRLGGTLPLLAVLAEQESADDRERLRPRGRRVPRPERELSPREPAAWRAHGRRAVSLFGRTALRLASHTPITRRWASQGGISRLSTAAASPQTPGSSAFACSRGA